MSSNQNLFPGLPPLNGGNDGRAGETQREQGRHTGQYPVVPSPGDPGQPSANPGHLWPQSPPDPSNPQQAPQGSQARLPGYGSDALAGSGRAGGASGVPSVTRVIPALRLTSNDTLGVSDDDSDLLVNGDLLLACQVEQDRVSREIEELHLLIKQASKELEKLNQRKVFAASHVRELEEHLELHSRQELRTAYMEASEAEMRAFMILEQREQLETKLRVYERYIVFLKRTIATFAAEPGMAQYGAPVADSAMADPWGMSQVQPMGQSGPGGPHASSGQLMPFAGHTAIMRAVTAASPGDELATLTRVIQAQENVRQRVAQRLHDGPTQSLANVMLTAEICERLVQSDETQRAVKELAVLKELVNATLQETRKFIFELRPMTLDDLGLVATLRRYANDVALRYQVQVPILLPQGERQLPKELETPVFRVAQEAIMNAIAHSRATLVQVTLEFPPNGLVLAVLDNGVGFDVEEALNRTAYHQTMGIASMQERAEILGGWLRIESTRGRGSRIELSVSF